MQERHYNYSAEGMRVLAAANNDQLQDLYQKMEKGALQGYYYISLTSSISPSNKDILRERGFEVIESGTGLTHISWEASDHE